MIIKINPRLAYLLDGATDRQKIWLAFWSYIYHKHDSKTWMNLHPSDYEFILGIDERLYVINSVGNTYSEASCFLNAAQRRHMGDEFSKEFQWRFENKQNVLWRSRTLSTYQKGKSRYPSVPTEITDPKAINCWCYLLGRLEAGNLVTNFKWFDGGGYVIDRMALESMGELNK